VQVEPQLNRTNRSLTALTAAGQTAAGKQVGFDLWQRGNASKTKKVRGP